MALIDAPQPSSGSNDTISHPATPQAATTATSIAAGLSAPDGSDIIAILSSATISSTGRRRFHFARTEESPVPEAGPSSRPASATPVEIDSDLESLPELPRALPKTQVKVSSSQLEELASDGKGKERAVSVLSTTESDDDLIFVKVEQGTPPRWKSVLPASQAILNEDRDKDPETPEKPFTPKRREGKKRARPSASHVRGRFALSEEAASISPRTGIGSSKYSDANKTISTSKGEPESPSISRTPRRLEDVSLVPSNSQDNQDTTIHVSNGPTLHVTGDPNSGLFFNNDTSRVDNSAEDAISGPQNDEEIATAMDIPMYTAADSDSDIDELAGSPSPPPLVPSAPPPEDEALQEQELLLEMTMDDTVPASQTIKAPETLKQIPHLRASTEHERSGITARSYMPQTSDRTPSASPVIPTPPDIVPARPRKAHVTEDTFNESLGFSNASSFGHSHEGIRKQTRRSLSSRSESEARSSESSLDSRSPSPIRRRDIIIISENKTRKRKHQRLYGKNAEIPELLFSSADSGASAESAETSARQVTPLEIPKPSKKNRSRKIRDDSSHPPGYRHRDAIVWTGPEVDGEFPYKELELIRQSCENSHHMDSHNRARFESLINDQLAHEEPKAPRIRLVDPENDFSCPAFNFVYTNRLIYRDVPQPAKAPGCGCTDGCKPNDDSCKCLQRQKTWTKRFPQEAANFDKGFAYDEKGRLVLPEDIPIIECNSNCGCPADCMNRQVSNGRRYALNLVKTREKGWGVEAASDRPSIRKGSFLCIYSGEVITWQESERRGQENDDIANPTSYLFDIDCSYISRRGQAFEKDGFQLIGDSTLPADSSLEAVETQNERFEATKSLYNIDAMKYGNIGRFFNHACSPNAYLRAVIIDDADDFKPILAVFAKKKIYPGEEITISYRGDVEGASDDHDSSTDDEGHGLDGVLTPRRLAANGAKNSKRKRKSWRMQSTKRKAAKSRSGKKKKAVNNSKQAGRIQAPLSDDFQVAKAECFCGAINCDGIMFTYEESSEDETRT
ncbi:SET domain-containing protein [Cystobasidium minutum MCA 4210]|uniref:SET domain-containing protein n=1 Tax=Cystobasidium minutum MCA 4210 TaxID=1397322 RepID=UPI0034CF8450|eukprot:jgi/Rhomi1/42291/CE42290_1015